MRTNVHRTLTGAAIIVGMVLAAGLSILAFGTSSNPSQVPAGASLPSPTARIVVSDIDLGILPSGGSRSMIIKASNPSAQACEVEDVEVSCPCTSLRLQRKAFPPSKDGYMRIDVNMAEEPKFVGDLGVVVRGTDRTGAEVMRFKVDISVISPNEISELVESVQPRGDEIPGENRW